jgi:hypothetical protein
MGFAYYPTFKSEVRGVDATSVSGKSIAKAMDELTAIAQSGNVRSLQDFVSVGADEIAALTGEDVADDAPPVRWFDLMDGLSSVRALIQILETKPDAVPRSDRIVQDLRAVESALVAAMKVGTQFRFTMDF